MNGDLSDYIRFGFLNPGRNVFTFESSGSEHCATLLLDGSLLDEDQRKHNDIYTWYLKYAEPPFNYKVKYKGVMFDLYQRYMKIIRSTLADLRREESFRLKELDSKELLNSDRTIYSEYIKTESNTDINEVNSNSSSTSDPISVESDGGITFSNPSSSKSSDLSESQSPSENNNNNSNNGAMKRKRIININNNNNKTDEINNKINCSSSSSNNNNNNNQNSLKQHITLLDGIKTGVFKPGKDVFSVKYNNIKYLSTLAGDGNIIYENNKYANPSRWVMHIYKRVNPSRKSVSGWKVIYYNNQPIINYVAMIEEKLSKVKRNNNNNNNNNGSNKRRKINNNNNSKYNYKYSDDEDDDDEDDESISDENEVILEEDNGNGNNNNNNNNNEEKEMVENMNNNNNNNKKNNKRQKQQQQKSLKKHNNNDNNNDNENNSENIVVINEDPEPIELQTIQLKPFIEKGIMKPGVDILEYIFNGINCRASLMKNGKIRDANYVKYKTPTEWGNAVLEYYDIKSRLNHWNRIRYDSQPLLYYYNLLLK